MPKSWKARYLENQFFSGPEIFRNGSSHHSLLQGCPKKNTRLENRAKHDLEWSKWHNNTSMDASDNGESEIAGLKWTERVTVEHYNVFGGTSFLTSPSHTFFGTYYWSPGSDILVCIWLLNEVWKLFTLIEEVLQPRHWCMIALPSFCCNKWTEFKAHTEKL